MGQTVKSVLTSKKKSGGGKGSRKYGRNKAKCALYRSQGRREKNKAKKQVKIKKTLEKKAIRKTKKKAI